MKSRLDIGAGHLPFAWIIDNHLFSPTSQKTEHILNRQHRLLPFPRQRYLIRINTSLCLSLSLGKSGGWISSNRIKPSQSTLER